MENYNNIVELDYTSENEWKKWIEKKFLPLYKNINIILKLREHIEKIFKNNFKEAFSQKNIKEMLLGGVNKEGDYTNKSLAKLYKDALGIFINPKEWIAYSKIGLDPIENGMKYTFQETSFLTFINEIKEKIEKVLYKLELNPPVIEDNELREIVKSPEKIVEIIREIYRLTINILVNYDYHMFFILNTRNVPIFFIEKAYPKIKNNFEKVVKILDLEEKIIPKLKDDKIKREYTIIGHKESGLADTLYSLNDIIWMKIWRNQIHEFIGITPQDFKAKYYEEVKKALNKIEWKKPEYIFISDPPGAKHRSGVSGPDYYTYHINDIMITSYSYYGWSARGNYMSAKNRKCNISYIKLLHDISPALFLGFYQLIVRNNSIQIFRRD